MEPRDASTNSLPSSYEQSPNFSVLFRNPISREYTVEGIAVSEGTLFDGNNSDKTLRSTSFVVHEVMAEPAANNIVPMKLMEFWYNGLSAFRNLICAPTDPAISRDDPSIDVLLGGLDRTRSHMFANFNILGKESVASFKKSTEKTDFSKVFIPTNLHLQSLSIRPRSSDTLQAMVRRDVTTVGAFTAQHKGAAMFATRRDYSGCSTETDNEKVPPAGLEFLWKSLPGQTLFDDDAGSSFVQYPPALEKFRAVVGLAALWEKICSEYFTDARAPCETIDGSLLKKLSSDSDVNERRSVWQCMGSLLKDVIKAYGGTASMDQWVVRSVDNLQSTLDGECPHIRSSSPKQVEVERKMFAALSEIFRDILNPDAIDVQGLFFRECIVMSQMITATVSAFLGQLYDCKSLDAVLLEQIRQEGLLIYYESLLSCWMDEKAMLEDMIGGFELLRRIEFVVPAARDDEKLDVNDIRVDYGSRGQMEIRLPPNRHVRQANSGEDLRFNVFPVLLNIGINEEASAAISQSKEDLQTAVNKYYGERLMEYTSKLGVDDSTLAAARADFARHLANSSVPKNVDLLHCAQSLTRLAHGLRFTMCKSAKDRTAMAVTFEQLTHVHQYSNGLTVSEYDRVLTEMRRNGTRRENTVKNIGVALYAFAQEQVEHLPAVYQPPPGTFGKSET
ncbi:putative Type I inositol 3,4-bisphosphate 4-phosphatase [Hypsibius exemplaris]|uniref:Type I inositol 3,4-bisphosphate 4-phosphatase n=1 Tax=Hypsibius exemplaris TaxID=2072580 RepID=A0A1W0WDT5_HYPEX|nr:putative Type I inositol 3,4-bisphosphate 4-phosphatase [Hypsibius exemplaris]